MNLTKVEHDCSMKPFDFGFCNERHGSMKNPFNSMRYDELMPISGLTSGRHFIFPTVVGGEPEDAEVLVALLLLSKYSCDRNTPVIVDVRYYDDNDFCIATDLKLIEVSHDCKSVRFMNNNNQVDINLSSLDAFNVKNIKLKKDFLEVFRKSYHFICKVRGYSDFLVNMMMGELTRETPIELTHKNKQYSGKWFSAVDGKLYYRLLNVSSGQGGACGGFGVKEIEFDGLLAIRILNEID